METKICKECGRELPIQNFGNDGRGGTHCICSECMGKKISEGRKNKKRLKGLDDELQKARTMRLEEFTPRELMKRLHDLGYDGTLKYTLVEIINISNF